MNLKNIKYNLQSNIIEVQEQLADGQLHRYTYSPDEVVDDNEYAEVKAVISALFTSEVVNTYLDKLAERAKQDEARNRQAELEKAEREAAIAEEARLQAEVDAAKFKAAVEAAVAEVLEKIK